MKKVIKYNPRLSVAFLRTLRTKNELIVSIAVVCVPQTTILIDKTKIYFTK